MTIFSFGIGIQLEGDAAAEVNALSQALHGLNAAIENVDGDNVDVAPLTSGAVTEAAQEAGAAFQTLGQRTAGMTQEAQASSEALRAIVDARVAEALEEAAENVMLFAQQMGIAQDDAFNLAQAVTEMESRTVSAGRRMKGVFENNARAIGQITGGAATAASSVVSLFEGLRDIVTLGGPSKIEEDMARLSGQMGQGAQRTMALWKEATKLSSTLKLVSAEGASQTIQAVERIGVSFTDLEVQTQHTAALMTDVFQMDPAVVADALGNARRLGVALEDVANQSLEFQKISGVPGVLDQLPTVLGAVTSAQVQFAGSVKKGSREITTDIQRMSVVYAKALGKDAVQATQLAIQTFQRFSGAVMANEDVFLGLADDFDPLTNAFLETGAGLESVQDLLANATTPEGQREFAQQVKAIMEGLDPASAQRFYRQVVRNVDEGTAQLLTLSKEQLANQDEVDRKLREKADQSAKEAEERAAADPAVRAARATTDAIAKFSEQMLDSVAGQTRIVENAMTTATEQLRQFVSPGIRQGLSDLAELISNNADRINAFLEGLDPNTVNAFMKGVAGLTTVAGAAGVAFGIFGATVGPLVSSMSGLHLGLARVAHGFAGFFTGSTQAATGARAVGTAATASESGLAVLGRGLAKVAGGAALVMAGAEPAAETLRELNSQAIATGESGNALGTILGSTVAGGLQLIDNLLLNIPSRLLGMEDGFDGVQSFITEMFTNLPQKVEEGLTKILSYIVGAFTWDNFLWIGSVFAKVGNSILEGLAHLPTAIMNIFQGTLNYAIDMSGAIAKALLRAVGVNSSTIESVNLFLDSMKYGFHLTFSIIRGTFNAFLDHLATTFAKAGRLFGVLTEEQAASLDAFAQGRRDASAADAAGLATLKEQIELRKRNIAALQEEEDAIAAAGGEEAYRAQQAAKELRELRVTKAQKMFGSTIPSDLAVAQLDAFERMQATTKSVQTAPAPPATTPPPNVVPQDAAPVPAAGGGDLGAVPGTVSPAEVNRRATIPPYLPPAEPAAARTPMQPGPIKVQLEVLIGKAASTLENVLRDLEFRVANGGEGL